jgi:GNAT superfamily N-acetyltransferase
MMRIEAIDNPDETLREAVNVELRGHNEHANPIYWEKSGQPENDERPLNLFAFASDGVVIAGLFASTRFSWLKIIIMSTKRDRRSQGIGRALLAQAETIARERGCKYAYVDTMEYQAPGFYSKAGYHLTGTLEDWDSHGHKKFFFVKNLL